MAQYILTGRIHNVSIGRPFAIGQRADILHGVLDDSKSTRVAVKVLRAVPYDDENARRELRQSLESQLPVWGALDHPNIVKFLGLSYDVPFPAAIILPYFSDGNALEYVKKYPNTVLQLLRGTAKGIEYLHQQNPPIVHADIRACNVLVDDGTPRLVDFGLVPVLSNTTFTTTNVVGPARWQAPEVFLTEDEDRLPFTLKTDIFSFAMFAIELVTQDRPFNHRKIDTVVIVDITKNRRPRKPVSDLADELWPLLEQCWAEAPGGRPTITAVCEGLEPRH
jgi:serine/threonine protein kinase